jgi:proline iminopeptidase
MEWQERSIAIDDGQLAYYEAGDGPAVIFLSGGPGDDHQYLRPLAEPLTDICRCTLLDQRGVGKSILHRKDAETVQLARFLDDLEQVRLHLGLEQLTLVGHSWGATYGLLYAAAFPHRVERLALVGLGPINDEMAAVAHANVLRPLSSEDLERRRILRQKRDEAVARGDREASLVIDYELLEMNSRSSFYSRGAAAASLAEMRASGSGPDRTIAPLLWPSVTEALSRLPERLPQVTGKVMALYGYQDFEPITQAYVLREWMPQTGICLLNECGHVPWREQPERFYAAMRQFLGTEA